MGSQGRSGIQGKGWECEGGIGAQGKDWNLGKRWEHEGGMGLEKRMGLWRRGGKQGMVSWGRDGIEKKRGSHRKERFMGKRWDGGEAS